jgi:hypothetical protein
MRLTFCGLAAFCLLAAPLAADEVTDTLHSAIEAYEAGDMQYALEEAQFAVQKMAALKTAGFAALLPEPQDGWTREMSDSGNAMAMAFGGGTMVEASYTKDGESFTISMIADSPMIASMGAMFANPALMQGELVRVGREKFVQKDDEITGLIANRILIQARGPETEAMLAHLKTLDFKALAAW